MHRGAAIGRTLLLAAWIAALAGCSRDDTSPDASAVPDLSYNTCPADFMSPDATCTPDSSCEYSDWEHGCSCSCASAGRWDCTPETIGSTCPSAGNDAGPS